MIEGHSPSVFLIGIYCGYACALKPEKGILLFQVIEKRVVVLCQVVLKRKGVTVVIFWANLCFQSAFVTNNMRMTL